MTSSPRWLIREYLGTTVMCLLWRFASSCMRCICLYMMEGHIKKCFYPAYLLSVNVCKQGLLSGYWCIILVKYIYFYSFQMEYIVLSIFFFFQNNKMNSPQMKYYYASRGIFLKWIPNTSVFRKNSLVLYHMYKIQIQSCTKMYTQYSSLSIGLVTFSKNKGHATIFQSGE